MYGHVITKFYRMGSLPHFLPMVLRCARIARESSGKIQLVNYKINNIINSTNYFGAIDKQYVDTGFLKLTGGQLTNVSKVPTQTVSSIEQVINYGSNI